MHTCACLFLLWQGQGEGHMINCLPPGTSELSHHDVGKNGNCSLSPSLHQFRTRVGLYTHRERSFFSLTNRCATDKGQHSWGGILSDDEDNWNTAGSMRIKVTPRTYTCKIPNSPLSDLKSWSVDTEFEVWSILMLKACCTLTHVNNTTGYNMPLFSCVIYTIYFYIKD